MSAEKVTIGNAELWHGDCRNVLPLLGKVDACITDPPYGVGFIKKKSTKVDTKKASVLYDDRPEMIKSLIDEVMPMILDAATRAVVFCGAAMLWNYPAPSALGCVFTPSGAGLCSWGFQCMHPILFYGKDIYLEDGKGSRPNSFRTEQPNREEIDHPCPKPVQWMEWAINRSARATDLVLDPFMGSGTTGVACMNLGRRFVGIEIDRHYFDIACERIARAQAQGRIFSEPTMPNAEQTGLQL